MRRLSKQLKLVIRGGQIKAVYDDALTALMEKGEIKIRRASHVEPDFLGTECKWIADMRPVDGPILTGFKTRREALDAEVRYLREYVVA